MTFFGTFWNLVLSQSHGLSSGVPGPSSLCQDFYELEKHKLGEGGFGAVRKGRLDQLDRFDAYHGNQSAVGMATEWSHVVANV